jgi:hypothetical protein
MRLEQMYLGEHPDFDMQAFDKKSPGAAGEVRATYFIKIDC